MNKQLFEVTSPEKIKENAKILTTVFLHESSDPFWEEAMKSLFMAMMIKKNTSGNLTLGRILNDIGESVSEWACVEYNRLKTDPFLKEFKEFATIYEVLMVAPSKTLNSIVADLKKEFQSTIQELALPKR